VILEIFNRAEIERNFGHLLYAAFIVSQVACPLTAVFPALLETYKVPSFNAMPSKTLSC